MARSREFTEIYGGKPYGSYQEMLSDPDVDIVYVATPHPMHEEHVIMAANAGKAILCEKPFAVNRQQAERMFEAARRNNVFLMEGLWSRFFPAWQYVREQLDAVALQGGGRVLLHGMGFTQNAGAYGSVQSPA